MRNISSGPGVERHVHQLRTWWIFTEETVSAELAATDTATLSAFSVAVLAVARALLGNIDNACSRVHVETMPSSG